MKREKIFKENIIIYGAGVNGKWVYEQLKEKKFPVAAFLDDKHFENIDNVPVMNEDTFKNSKLASKETTVIISFFVKNMTILNDLKSKLSALGIEENNIYHFVEVFMDTYFALDKVISEQKDIEQAFSLLKEDESKKVFTSYIQAVKEENADLFVEPTEQEQYFDKDIFPLLRQKEGYFVDCGAYIGDTFDTFVKQNLNMNYVGIEPDINNFCQLGEVTVQSKIKTVLFPCATSDCNELVGFSYSGVKSDSPGSAIVKNGNITVPGVALDSIISGLEISLIKMDVEGAEEASLRGACKIISSQHPDLAICTYHKTEDIWKLMNQIHSYYPGYHFYLRSYYLYGRETVLYAVNE